MENSLSVALVITAVGMGLVFGAILLLAVLTGLLTRLTSRRERPGARGGEADAAERELKLRAATAAVAVALARQDSQTDTLPPRPFPLPPTALVSTWQAVMRARLMGQRRTVR